jgi:hypothetical protein
MRCSPRPWHIACVDNGSTEEVIMARSTLNTTGESNPVVRRGHGTGALGPSDSTDSGSDIVGGPGLNHEDGLPLERGTTSDPDVDAAGTTAGADIGDADLDSDTDRYGTGERGAAGRDSARPVDEVLTTGDGDGVESIDESDSQRDASDIESDDRPDEEVEAGETIARRRGADDAARKRSS